VYGSLDIAVSGMIAQRTRMEVATANLVNKDSNPDAKGNVFQRLEVMFAPGDPHASTPEARQLGVHVADIHRSNTPPRLKYDPTSPFAYKSGPNAGYVPVPDIDSTTEMFNFMEAQRAYEACAVAADTTKAMMAQALRLLA
jgi:flagellar basal-body rod protein FlgC